MPSDPPTLFTLNRMQWPYQSKIAGSGPGVVCVCVCECEYEYEWEGHKLGFVTSAVVAHLVT